MFLRSSILQPIFAHVGAGRKSERPLAQLSGPCAQTRMGQPFDLPLETGSYPASPIT